MGEAAKPLMARTHQSRLWIEAQGFLSAFTGLSAQLFDERGRAVGAAADLPPLCALLARHPETAAACRKDCFRRAAACGSPRRILAGRCYAGLSYRLVPVRRRNRPHAIILVGRVQTEVVGAEQCGSFIERYRLPREAFLEALAGIRSLAAADLDRAAESVRRIAASAVVVDARLESRHAQLERRRRLFEFARQAASSDRGPGRERRMLEALRRMLCASGVALLLPGDGAAGALGVHASVGLDEEALHCLSRHDWQRLLASRGDGGTRLLLGDRRAMLDAGLDCADGTIALRRLEAGRGGGGLLVATGPALTPADADVLDAAAEFVAAHVEHERVRERSRRNEEEARLLGVMAERCLSARSVDELLPLALEALMHSLHARRGSILLAGDEGRIVARALRGPHAPISDTIDVLQPDSVSHRVFFNRQPLLVRDTDRELAARRERQFPYATRSFVSVPLRENGHALGVIHLTEREGEEEFTPHDLSLLERLSLQAAGAISRARLEEEVRWLRVASGTDHLTGVYNRRFFEQRLGEEIQRAERFGLPLAIAMLDIDGFKALNDEMGHEFGDRTLRGLAETVRGQLRAVDVVARYGGDEFVVLLPGTGPDGALRLAEKIRAHVAAAALQGRDPSLPCRRCTVSLGVSVYSDRVRTAEQLLRSADASLFEAKRSGRNAVLIGNC